MRRALLAAGLRLAAAVLLPGALVAPASARDIPGPPAAHVLDEAGWLSPSEESSLSQELLGYERETSNQIVVAVFRSLDGEDLADFSQRVAEAWGVGRGDRDNGILLAVYVAERQVDIEVGYGLEAVVTDLIAEDIRTGILVPAFREQRYAAGLADAVQALKAAARGEYQGTGRALSDEDRDGGPPFWVLLLLFLVIAIAVSRLQRSGGMILGPPGWGDAGRGWRWTGGGGWGGGFGGGFGGGGGGGGGGFRGGGGSFGGGGASGSW